MQKAKLKNDVFVGSLKLSKGTIVAIDPKTKGEEFPRIFFYVYNKQYKARVNNSFLEEIK